MHCLLFISFTFDNIFNLLFVTSLTFLHWLLYIFYIQTKDNIRLFAFHIIRGPA